jgi:signal transduction histidine kinase
MTEGATGTGADGGTWIARATAVVAGLAGARLGLQKAEDRGLRLLTVVGWIVSPTTWLALIHLCAGLVIGLMVGAVILTGIGVGVSMVAVFGLGIVILAATFWFGGQVARAERARFALLLGERIVPPEPLGSGLTRRRRIWRAATRAVVWKNLGYSLLRLPLSAVEVVPLMFVWSGGLALTTLPFYNGALPGGSAHLGEMRVAGFWWTALATLIGLGLLFIAPVLTRALAVADASAARWLIGSPRQAGMAARIGELETSRARVIDAAEAERLRIERDLHDGAQQRLVSLAMELGRAKVKFETDPQAAAAIVGQAHEQAKEALTELRNLVRGVHPPVLTDRGLDAALSGLAALSPVPVTVRVDLPVRPPAGIEAIAYFVVAEALTNVAKHARASLVEVRVSRSGNLLNLVIFDDGVGGADPAGQGLSGLAARVAGVDGQLRVTSPAGGPTSIGVVLPCGS